MIRALINSVPTGPLLIVGTLVAVVAAIGATLLVRKRWPGLADGAHNDVANSMITVAGTLYAIILGFVVVNAYTSQATTTDAVRNEATQLAQLYRDTRGMPRLAEPVAIAMHDYIHAVVEQEWPAMRNGIEPDASSAPLTAMFAAFQAYEPTTAAETAFYSEAIRKLNEVVGSRRLRLSSAAEEMPAGLTWLFIGGAFLLVGLALFFGVAKRRVHVLLIAGLAALLAYSVLLSLALDYPFSGDLSVSSDPFRSGALELVWGD